MASFDNITITRAGRSVLAYSLANSKSIEFVRLEIGDGDAPSAPEMLSGLVRKVLDIPISKITNPEEGVTTVRGSFRSVSIQENLYLREIGLYVKGVDGSPVLFGYCNAGSLSDYIPKTGGTSLMEEVLQISIITGTAEVLFQNVDPNAAATMEDLKESLDALNIEDIKDEIDKSKQEISDLKDELDKTSEGFVKKAGDTMTGDLTAPNFAGHLIGSADQWNGWVIHSNIFDLNTAAGTSLTKETATVQEIVGAMKRTTRFLDYLQAKNPNMPADVGVLEVQKLSDDISIASFTAIDGRTWKGSYSKTAGWSSWGGCMEIPPCSAIPYDGTDLPIGYLWPWGQAVSRTTYARIYAGIGNRYGAGDGKTTFNLPNFRGLFLRCLDNGMGIDPGRTIGSTQSDAIRNITGTFDANSDDGTWGKTGPFYPTNIGFAGANGNGSPPGALCGFDISRVVPTSNENRPVNIALNYIYKY